tara:strand:+ start:326 stop:463 length:138 start_codon:yes stop_codon:yes gene_type:complete
MKDFINNSTEGKEDSFKLILTKEQMETYLKKMEEITRCDIKNKKL